jgi:hypothetical protein
VRITTDAAWTSTAGDPFDGASFAEKGVIAGIFLLEGVPVEGMVLKRDPDGVVPADDFYFSDANPLTRTTVDPLQDATGPNGTALMVNSGAVYHLAQGYVPDHCYWGAELAKSLPGAVVVTEFHARDSSTDNPCSMEIFADGFEGGFAE